MRTIGLLLLLVAAGCELEGPEDKRRDGETFAEAEARHRAEREASKQADPVPAQPRESELAPGVTELDARRDGDSVVVRYRGWLACDGKHELRSAGASGTTLKLVIVDTNTSSQRASCSGPVELSARLAHATATATAVRIVQGTGHRVLTAPIQR